MVAGFQVGEIGADADRFHASRFDGRADFVESFVFRSVNHHVRAGLGETDGDARAQAGSGAGDQGVLTVEAEKVEIHWTVNERE